MTRTLLLSLHIASIAAWLGADIVQHALGPRIAKESVEANTGWARLQAWLHQTYYAVVVVFILGSGIGLVLTQDWSWGSGFIWVGIGTVIAGGVLGGGVLQSLAKKRVAAFEAGDGDRAAALRRRMKFFEVTLTLLVLVTVLAMVDKWQA